MHSTDFRIGNYVANGEQILIITGLVGDFIETEPVVKTGNEKTLYLQPIPITPEWLQKCGFIDPAKNGFAYRININTMDEICYYVSSNELRYQTIRSGFTRWLDHIRYIHQLQNWFYYHIGHELKIDLA